MSSAPLDGCDVQPSVPPLPGGALRAPLFLWPVLRALLYESLVLKLPPVQAESKPVTGCKHQQCVATEATSFNRGAEEFMSPRDSGSSGANTVRESGQFGDEKAGVYQNPETYRDGENRKHTRSHQTITKGALTRKQPALPKASHKQANLKASHLNFLNLVGHRNTILM